MKRTKSLVVFTFFCIAGVCAQSKKPAVNISPAIDISGVKKMAYADSARLAEIFKDLHLHPELGFTEKRTSAIIASELQTLGYKVFTNIGKTGLAAVLQNGEGPIVMYRADMDALPIKETTNLAYASTITSKKDDGTDVPVMHACGHDAHVTWMLGVAKIMAASKNMWKGTLVFVAQPAEELILGADAMVKDNMYKRGVPFPDYIFGMHTRPFPVGDIENGAGVRMAGSDQFDVTFNGVTGHGSTPHLAKDPVIMSANAILDYQSIVSRSVSAQNPHVITVGSVVAGTANNIIPASATLKINTRWFTLSDRKLMIDGINRVDSSIALANDLAKELYPTIVMKGIAYPLSNDTLLSTKINTALSSFIPREKINTTNLPAMGSEDFPILGMYGSKRPVSDYVLVGIASPEVYYQARKEGKDYPFYLHNSNYTVDLSAIPFGTTVGAVSILEIFRK
jgi:amidohydrolase